MAASTGKGRVIILWVVRIVLALGFVFAGVPKLMNVPQMVEAFAKLGLGQWFRYFTGVLEIIGGIGLLIPRFTYKAALLLAIIMLGAVAANLARLHQSTVPAFGFLLLCILVMWLSRSTAKA